MGWPSGATRPSSSVTGSSYSYRLPLSAPATNADFTGSVALRNATVPVSIVPSRVTVASKSPSLIAPAGRSLASTSSSTVPGVSGAHDVESSTTLGVTWLARTVPATTKSATRARIGERDRDIGDSCAMCVSIEHRRALRHRRFARQTIRCRKAAHDGQSCAQRTSQETNEGGAREDSAFVGDAAPERRGTSARRREEHAVDDVDDPVGG